MALLSKTNLVCVALCFCISEECLPTAARAQANADPVIQTFPVANDGDLLIVPVKLKGKKYDFAIDTGATSIVYDSSLRSLLGEFVQAGEIETVSKTTGVSFFKAPQAWLGKLSLQVDTPVV